MSRRALFILMATLTLACQPKESQEPPPGQAPADAQAQGVSQEAAADVTPDTASAQQLPETSPPPPNTPATGDNSLGAIRLPRSSTASKAIPTDTIVLALDASALRFTNAEGQNIALPATAEGTLATDTALESTYGKSHGIQALEDSLRALGAKNAALFADPETPFGLTYDVLASARLAGVPAPVLAFESVPDAFDLAKAPQEVAAVAAPSGMSMALTLPEHHVEAAKKRAEAKAEPDGSGGGGTLALVGDPEWDAHRLYIHPEGFTLSGHGQTEATLERCEAGEGKPGICLLAPEAERAVERYDWLALHNATVAFEAAHQNATELTVRVHRDVPLEVVVAALDVVGPRRATSEEEGAAQTFDSMEALSAAVTLAEPRFAKVAVGPWDGKTLPKKPESLGLLGEEIGTLGLSGTGGLGVQGGPSRGCGMPSSAYSGIGLGPKPGEGTSYGGGKAEAKFKPGKPEVKGSFAGKPEADVRIVRKVVTQHKLEIRHCYKEQLAKNSQLKGTIIMRWSVSPTGVVVMSQVQSNTMSGADGDALGMCLARRIKTWRFPAPKNGGLVMITVPLLFGG